MKWTSNPPTEPGWYWWRYCDPLWNHRGEWEIVRHYRQGTYGEELNKTCGEWGALDGTTPTKLEPPD